MRVPEFAEIPDDLVNKVAADLDSFTRLPSQYSSTSILDLKQPLSAFTT